MKYFITSAIVCLMISLTAYAQDWTWMKGSSTGDQPGTYGTINTPDPGNTPGARYGTISWTDNTGNFWLFGGYGFDRLGGEDWLNDLWMYNKGTGNWTWKKGSDLFMQVGVYGTIETEDNANTPGGRAYSASWVDNSGNLWLFGGDGTDEVYGPPSPNNLSDLWRYNITTGNWTWMKGSKQDYQGGNYGTINVEDDANLPGGRMKSAFWKDNTGDFWLFGGDGLDATSAEEKLNDLWQYNVSNNKWTWMKGSSSAFQAGTYGTIDDEDGANTPGGRSGSASWVDNLGNLWLFGGLGYDNADPNNHLNDLWMYNITSGDWTWKKGDNTGDHHGVYGSIGVEDGANNPGGRYGAASWVDGDGNLWLTGGVGLDETGGPIEMSDVWMYDITSGNWTWIKGDKNYSPTSFGVYGTQGTSAPANNPGGRKYPAYWNDIGTNNLWVWGGEGYDDGSAPTVNMNDMWRLAGGVLPVELQSFTASVVNDGIKLSWNTASEINNYGFEIQRLQNYKIARLQDWEKIGFVKGAGNSNSQKQYYITDNNMKANDNYQYRLKQIDNDGAFEYSQVIEASFLKPMTFALEQNYPNPFNPNTNFEFRVSSASGGGLVTLIIYDVLGNEVATLVNEVKEPGVYNINYNAAALSSGVYIYQLKAGDFISAKTMMILK